MMIVFSWWQCIGRSRESSAQSSGPAASSWSRTARAMRRDGLNTGSGAPAQSSTRTCTRRAASASRFRTTTGSSPPRITNSGDRNQPLTCTECRAARISSTIRPSAASPSISTSSDDPGRGGGASSAHPPSTGSSGNLPCRASRR